MKRIIVTFFTLFLLNLSAFALEFKIASYNVENLFDLQYDKTEYEEYIPDKTNWNKTILDKKLTNISKVINDLDADIVALQEIESETSLLILMEQTPKYKYYSFIKNPLSSIGLGIISKFEIIETKSIPIDTKNTYSRPILEATLKIDNKLLKVYVNHWRSKAAGESARIPYAKSLYKHISIQNDNIPYIILGDFNSNYDEFQTFLYDKKLNDTKGITAINDILRTTIKGNFITQETISSFNNEIVHYNLWLEIPYYERYNYKFKGTPNTPDSIIISSTLINGDNISYINNSFGVFKPEYIYKKGHIQKWNMDKKGFHKGSGYSDHLPIFASFNTNQKTNIKKTIIKNIDSSKISNLYNIESLSNQVELKNVIILYKDGNSAIIKQQNDRAIFVYNQAKNLSVGKVYDITIDKISRFYGQLQITNIINIKEINANIDIKSLFIDGHKSDLFNYSLQNEIITGFQATYSKRDLHYNNKSIRLYAKNKDILPPQNSQIIIKKGHLSLYNNTPQIVIYSKDDYEIIK
ncbi:MAG: endonuclease/exonuclease/phosphatase family protein [Arcobacteraceae bacterium]|nr:endonuclease/exonuclease/phosphatase family protein [Arcobacteraceae bacterium]